MIPVDLTNIPPSDHVEIIGRLLELNAEADVDLILQNAEFYAERALIGIAGVGGNEPSDQAAGLGAATMMGALRAGLTYLGASAETANLACFLALDTFNAKLATLRAGAPIGLRH